jgi:hypothetical protein
MGDIEEDKYGVVPLSNFDLINEVAKDLNDRVNIVDTTRLDNLNNVEDIFRGTGHAILFLPSDEPNNPVGHWVSITRQHKGGRMRKGSCVYFDSMGDPLKINKIKQILKEKYKTIEENNKKYQQYGTNLCGYYCLLNLTCNKIFPDYNLEKLNSVLQTKPKNMSYDEYVGHMMEAL